MRPRVCAVLLLATVAIAGCSSPFTKIAPAPPIAYEPTRQAEGGACGALLLGVIPIGVNSRMERAYQEALKNAGATGLTDTKVTDRWYWIYLGDLVCTDVEGMGFREANTTSAVP
jgi:hypothetical protein